ncbi:XrtA-associated tyrosine autokinase [Lacisediminimonas profundi]|uniref:XrtA-associated tyrosine autokinase n=1 Tax=Lacisediminimonas profundi TaxID=2603856 RepID=UPI00124B7ADB|nr:XrtA-associated tyrosine autokinase [Lacisediminimonas profundi]
MSIIENAVRRLNQTSGIEPEARPESGSASAAAQGARRAENKEAWHPDDAGTRAGTLRPVAPREQLDIDLERLRERGMVVASNERSAIGEEFRTIKRPLLLQVASQRGIETRSGRPANVIMVTSSAPGEGKTYCAVNLAMSIAYEKDYQVLLVDADVARPSVPRTLGLPERPGLMDVLQEGGPDLEDAIIDTNVASLSILTAGTKDRHATELLSSQGMARLVAEMANRFPDRIVIFDSPPLLATSESQVLANHMGQIVVVVEALNTTQRQLKEALHMLDGRPDVSLIYNKARRFSSAAMYGSYY